MTKNFALRPSTVIAILLVAMGLTPSANGQATIDPVEKWAHGTNAGWLNFAPTHGGVVVRHDHLQGYAWAENIGWLRLGTNAASGLHTYSNASPDDYGVNHDGAGNLSGYAWGTNVGWINFSPTHGGVTIDLATGEFHGDAWAENVGWIRFKGTGSTAYGVKARVEELLGAAVPAVGTAGLVVLALLMAGIGIVCVSKMRTA